MKTLRFLILGLLLSAALCRGQDDQEASYGEGWFLALDSVPAAEGLQEGSLGFSSNAQVPGGNMPIAETNTPEIAALARGLENDPKRIFDYVHDHIRYVHYFGSHKGAQLTLLERSGNDFDQCALLVALLRAAGLSPTYQFGVVSFPYSATDHQDYQHWVGTTLTNADWDTTFALVYMINVNRGFPFSNYFTGQTNELLLHHVWVQLSLGGTNYLLDPSFKVCDPIAGIDLDSAMGLNTSNLMSLAGGTATADYVQGLSEASVRSTLQGYTTSLLSTLQNSYPNSSVQQIAGGQQIVSSAGQPLGQPLAFTIQTQGGAWPLSSWTYIPTNLMAVLRVSLLTTNNIFYTPSLGGDRLSLTFSSSGLAQLWQQDSQVASIQATTGSNSVNVVLGIQHPYGTWDFGAGSLIRSNSKDQSVTNAYQNTNAAYALVYAFEAAPAWLAARQRQLEAYRQQGYGDDSRQVQTETLNVMGLNWLVQTESKENLLATELGVLPQWHHRLGRMAQESGHGYYVDVFAQLEGTMPAGGVGTADIARVFQAFDASGYLESAMEHGLIEQMQASNLVAASTVKMLQLGNTNGLKTFLANSGNWTSIRGQLSHHDTNEIYGYVAQGFNVLLPADGAQSLAGAGSWSGTGYVGMRGTTNSHSIKLAITGHYQGGYSAFPQATLSPATISAIGSCQPGAYSLQSSTASVQGQYGADPVSMADGTFHISHTDLALGGVEPRGLKLSRSYNSSRRNSNLAGMAPGWLHNYVCSVAEVPAPLPGLGTTTPQQMAPMLVATRALLQVYTNTVPNPKNWLVTALIAKWGVDQLIRNGVSVSLGEDTIQFIKQPNGTFTPPANCTMTLLKTNSAYWLQQRHGNTFKFDSVGRLSTIVDQYNNPLSLTYTNNLVKTVTDWKNRSLTFTYTGGQLTSVSDNSTPSRTIHYSYSTATAQGDLISFTDAEGKASTYACDANHQITATLDALNQLVVSNLYDGFGHVATQYTQGDVNKTWQIFWSGWQTVEQDPAGGKRRFFYDDKTRLIAQQDALGSLGQMVYDGQDHLVLSISPLNETNLFIYDGNHNLIYSIDPLGFTNQFVYDSSNRLTSSIDPLGNHTTFGYNSQFSLTGQTNGAGDWVNYAYTASGQWAGTLNTRTDAGGQTSYGYDSTYAQLISITYPGSLGIEYFTNNALGDVTGHADARGFATAFKYNNRRQLTNSIAPTNLTVKVSIDAIGNVASVTDARNNTASNTWSATRHLLATALPATAQGTPIVTNIYDNRDWLVKTLDPYQQPTLYTNDANGRLISVTDPVLRTTTFGYDADSRKIAATNAALEVTSQTWDARGSLLQLTDGTGHFSTRVYDAAGNQIYLTNRNGKVWQFYFDKANRLTNTISPKLYSTILVFNHQGLVSSIKDPANQTTTNTYDGLARLITRGDKVGSISYKYDKNSNLTNVTETINSQLSTLNFTYDAYNRVSAFTNADGYVIQYRYDANGNVTSLIYPGNRTVMYFYDSLNRLTNVTDWAQRKTTITYDLASRVTNITRPNGTYRTIACDAAGQTTNILEQMSNSLPIAIFKFNWTNSGSMAWEFAAPLPHSSTAPTRNMTYDDDNRLATFKLGTTDMLTVGSDADGNLTNAPLMTNALVAYTYDARNRLLNAGGVTNSYDAINNRIGQTSGTNIITYVVNPNAKLPQVLMRIKNGVTNYYIYGAGLLYQITETATATNTLTYHYDYRGSTIALTDGNGNVTDRIEYSAYGLTTYRAGTNDTPFLFNGRYGVQTDSNGLLYMRARYYNPYLCRFVSSDPAGFGGGLNHYTFANGNPVSYLDPFGLGAVGEGSSGSYWIDTGREFQGLGSAVGNTASGLWSAATSPIDTAANIVGSITDYPYETSQAIASGLGNTWNNLTGSDPRAQGQAVGNVLIFGGTLAAPFARAGTTSVFWSGYDSDVAAQTWAVNNGGRTLSMSPFAVGQDATPAALQSASTSFAREAGGNVQVFQPAAGVPINGVWAQFEYPALMQNPNVSGITYQIIDGSGNVIRTIPVPR